MKKLDGKRVLLTGASSGIGRALAREMAKEGAVLALSARRTDALVSLADEIVRDGGAPPAILTADLSVRGEAHRLGQAALKALGVIDVLVNNAGVTAGGTQWTVGDGEAARTLFETNYFTPLALTAELVPQMRARGTGTVVNVASVGAVVAFPLVGHYSSSKAALALASDALRSELAGTGVDVLCVMPGPVATPMLSEANAVPEFKAKMGSVPTGRADVLAKKIVRGIVKKQEAFIYPSAYSAARHFPTFARWLNRLFMGTVHIDEQLNSLGGSAGDPLARAERARFEAAQVA